MTDIFNEENAQQNTIKISDDVVSKIAGIAATEIEGVAGMSGGITGGISEMLGMKNLSKGIKVEVSHNEAIIDLNIIVDFGTKLSELGKKVQENVKNSVETMTGLQVTAVNVNIQGVNIPKESKTEV